MKTKYYAVLLAVLLIVCAALSVYLFQPGSDAAYARITSDGEVKYTLSLAVDQQITVESERGTNVVTVKDGKIAVTQADCPDHYCMDRGFCSGGAQIVCLPNRLVIEFVGEQAVDGVTG